MTGFTFFQNYFDSISDEENGLSEEEQGRLYNAIFAYMFRDEEPNLKGACKLAFNLIKPSLDLSKIRSKAGSVKQTEIKPEQNEINPNQKEIKPEQTEIKSETSPFFENKEREEEREDINTVGLNARTQGKPNGEDGMGDIDETVEGYMQFHRDHPTVQADITNPSLIATVDWNLLGMKIQESRYLQGRKSLRWLIDHYSKIVLDTYKDFAPKAGAPPDIRAEKGDLQLWRELINALAKAKELRFSEHLQREVALFRMADEAAKQEMGELYKALSPEIADYFEPNSFLELCTMSENDLKYERARFLKALPSIRKKIAGGG